MRKKKRINRGIIIGERNRREIGKRQRLCLLLNKLRMLVQNKIIEKTELNMIVNFF